MIIENSLACFGLLTTKNCHFPFASTRMKSVATVVSDLQNTLKGVHGGGQEWGTLLWEKLAEQVFRWLDIFRRFYEPNFLYLLISRKALKLLTKTSAPGDLQQPSVKMCAWLHVPTSLKSHVCWPLWSSSSELSERLFPRL